MGKGWMALHRDADNLERLPLTAVLASYALEPTQGQLPLRYINYNQRTGIY